MLKQRTQQHIRFAKIEQPNAWVVVAVLLETTGNETVAISEPKVVKVIPKAQFALPGGKKQSSAVLLLSAPYVAYFGHSLTSPYFSLIFGSEKSNFIIGLAAQPPTFK
jgi:hypothetical protein